MIFRTISYNFSLFLNLYSSVDTEELQNRRDYYLAVIVTIVNLFFLVIQGVAVYLSGSYSVISSLVDAACDLVTSATIWITNRMMKRRDPYNYPRGRTRLEPIALIIISIIMGVASVQIIIQSLEAIITNKVIQCKNTQRSLILVNN